MLKNYLLVALRNMYRNKIFTAINIIGLAIGISASMVIFLIVQFHFSFDRFEKDRNRIYRVVTETSSGGDITENGGAPGPLPDATKKEASGISLIAAFHEWQGQPTVTTIDGKGKPTAFPSREDVILADPGYFQLIPYEWLAGSPAAMSEPFKVVLTEQRARSYFPGLTPVQMIGKTITYDDSIQATVTGIVKEISARTTFIYTEMLSQSTLKAKSLDGNYYLDNWGALSSSSLFFLKLNPGSGIAAVEKQINDIFSRSKPKGKLDGNTKMHFILQPLSEMHFDSRFPPMRGERANLPTLYGLTAVAVLLLLLACINFINLSTAQATRRAKETGVRKSMGGSRGQLIFQYLSETFFLTLIATLLSVVLVPGLLKIFSDFIPEAVRYNPLHQPEIALFLLALVVVVGVLSGLYPALVLSRFQPAQVLKNQVFTGSSGSRSAWLRKGLTISQFFIAQVFVMATVLTVKQIHFMLNKDMGFRREAIVSVSVPVAWTSTGFSKTDRKRFVLMNEFRRLPGIQRVSLSSAVPASNGFMSTVLNYAHGETKTDINSLMQFGDSNYLSLFHIPLLAGRNVQGDTIKEYVINETLMHLMGYQHPADVLNKTLGGKPVVGVMGDFNQQSLHEKISPLLLTSYVSASFNISVALNPETAGGKTWKKTLAEMGKMFKSVYPETDYQFDFFDESIARFYQDEQNVSKLLSWATGLAIFISCMGLLGLVIFTTTQKTKEIGVRKILGASIGQLVTLLSKDFLILVLIAFVMATPVAWWAIHQWLSGYAYRTPVSWWIFVASGAGMLALALITLGIQTFRAGSANPVESLRSE